MKKNIVYIFFICWAISSTSFAAISFEPTSENETHELTLRKGKKTKSGRYKKRGGLFGRKNDCGCPKH
jgi:hypothetical protein